MERAGSKDSVGALHRRVQGSDGWGSRRNVASWVSPFFLSLFVSSPAGPTGKHLGEGGGPQPKEKVLWTGLSGTCGGHVAGPWSPGAPPPPSCLGEGRSKKAWGALLSQRGMRHLLSIPSQQILEAQQQLGPIF